MCGPVTQTIETDSKLVPLVKLIGDTYAYWCRKCGQTIYEQELILRAKVGTDCDGQYVKSSKVTEQKCPFCYGPIQPLQPGDKVRVHYRFDQNGQWAAWWAERWEW
jgi:Zn finger protein HypA/HybF involved in hydrogenase expression